MAGDAKKNPSDVRVVVTNRKARHLYHIDDSYEAGIALKGTEVKSLRAGAGSLADAYAEAVEGELWVVNFHIPPYEQGNRFNVESRRRRKLLLNKREIRKMIGAVSQKGCTLVPLRVYFRGQYVKLELALARGKREYDKRESIKERQMQRDMERDSKWR